MRILPPRRLHALQERQITGISHDGGYAEYTIARAEAVAAIPEDLPAAEAAPLLCAGITVFNALRNSGAAPGDLVAVQGIGGLGHLGVQYARQMGFRTVAIGRGADKEPLARKLGAHDYIDSAAGNPADALQKLGGARVILATAPDSKSMSTLIDGIGSERKNDDRGRKPRVFDGDSASIDRPTPRHTGLAFRLRHRLGGHAELQRADRRPPDDRKISSGKSSRSVSADDQREGKVSRSAGDHVGTGAFVCPNVERAPPKLARDGRIRPSPLRKARPQQSWQHFAKYLVLLQ